MAKKIVLTDNSGNKCYPVTRDECIKCGNKTLPEKFSELGTSEKFNTVNSTFNNKILLTGVLIEGSYNGLTGEYQSNSDYYCTPKITRKDSKSFKITQNGIAKDVNLLTWSQDGFKKQTQSISSFTLDNDVTEFALNIKKSEVEDNLILECEDVNNLIISSTSRDYSSTFISGKYINTSGEIGSTVNVNAPSTLSSYSYIVLSCEKGQKFRVTGSGGSGPRLWCFVDSSNRILSNSEANLKGVNIDLEAPLDSDKLIINVLNAEYYQLISANILSTIIEEVEALTENFSALENSVEDISNSLFQTTTLKKEDIQFNSGVIDTTTGNVNSNPNVVWYEIDITNATKIQFPIFITSSTFGAVALDINGNILKRFTYKSSDGFTNGDIVEENIPSSSVKFKGSYVSTFNPEFTEIVITTSKLNGISTIQDDIFFTLEAGNIIQRDSLNFIKGEGFYSVTTGKLTTDTSKRWGYYEVNVEGFKRISVPSVSQSSNGIGVCFFDAEDNYLGGYLFREGYDNTRVEIDIPSGAVKAIGDYAGDDLADIWNLYYLDYITLFSTQKLGGVSEKIVFSINQLYHTINKKYKRFLGYAITSTTKPLTPLTGDYFVVKQKGFSNIIFEAECKYDDVLYFDGTKWVGETITSVHELESLNKSKYDICIVGGGAAGVGAGFALISSGLNVCMIDRESSLGGTHINAYVVELLPNPTPPFFKTFCEKHQPIFNYVKPFDSTCYVSNYNARKGNSHKMNFASRALADAYYNELSPYIDIKFRRELIGAEISNGVVESIKVKNLVTGGEETIYAKMFIDASGGELCKITNGEENTGYYWGTDGYNRFNEAYYASEDEPDRYAINTLEIAFRIKKGGTEDLSKLPVPSGVSSSLGTGLTDLDNKDFKLYFVTSGGSGMSAERFINEGYNSSYQQGLINGPACWKKTKEVRPQDQEYTYDRTAPMLGIREGVRIVCDEMLVQDDLIKRITSDDIPDLTTSHYIAMSCWWADIHGASGGDEIKTQNRGIKYEHIIPKYLKNVLVPGRGMGCSHVAQGACRTTKTMLSVGNAAGYAAIDFVKNYKDDVRAVDISYIQSEVDIEGQIRNVEKYYENPKHGYVYQSDGITPVQEATVYFILDDGVTTNYTVQTDSNGKYDVELSPGTITTVKVTSKEGLVLINKTDAQIVITQDNEVIDSIIVE